MMFFSISQKEKGIMTRVISMRFLFFFFFCDFDYSVAKNIYYRYKSILQKFIIVGTKLWNLNNLCKFKYSCFTKFRN
jgi:hypothetical protein